jgi:hypothetical protein
MPTLRIYQKWEKGEDPWLISQMCPFSHFAARSHSDFVSAGQIIPTSELLIATIDFQSFFAINFCLQRGFSTSFINTTRSFPSIHGRIQLRSSFLLSRPLAYNLAIDPQPSKWQSALKCMEKRPRLPADGTDRTPEPTWSSSLG